MNERACTLTASRSLPLLLLTLAASCAAPPDASRGVRVRGPIEARIQHPLALTFLGPRARTAETLGEGNFRVGWQNAYSSIYEENTSVDADEVVVFDGEFLQSSLMLRYGLGPNTDIDVEIGGLYTTSGSLDQFADEFHETLQLPDGGRDLAPRDEFLMALQADGATLYDLREDHVGMMDVPVWLVHSLQREEPGRIGVAIRGGVELPVGEEDDGLGNGKLDYGVGVLLEKTFGERLTVSGGVDYVVTGDPDAFERAGVEVKDIVQLALGGEWRISRGTSVLTQLLWYSPLVPDFELEEINREIFDLGIGFATDLGREVTLFGAFHEDVVAATGADFTFLLGVTWEP